MSIIKENMPMYTKHPDTFLPLQTLGTTIPSYKPTVNLPSTYLSQFHWWLAHCPLRQGLVELRDGHDKIIEGWLRRDDALKLYEIAYVTQGDILELGAYHGLSTSILARACEDASCGSVYSVDLDPKSLVIASKTLSSLGLLRYVNFVCSDAVGFVESLAKLDRRFAFVFVDHSHAYTPVYSVCRQLGSVVMPGGFCLFHDFNDIRNSETTDEDYAVYQAVLDGLNSDHFEFYGIYGCTALYRRQ